MCEIAMSHVASLGVKDTHTVEGIMAYSDSGLPGILFSLLDQEEDQCVVRNTQHTLTSMLSAMASDNLTTWLHLCKVGDTIVFYSRFLKFF